MDRDCTVRISLNLIAGTKEREVFCSMPHSVGRHNAFTTCDIGCPYCNDERWKSYRLITRIAGNFDNTNNRCLCPFPARSKDAYALLHKFVAERYNGHRIPDVQHCLPAYAIILMEITNGPSYMLAKVPRCLSTCIREIWHRREVTTL